MANAGSGVRSACLIALLACTRLAHAAPAFIEAGPYAAPGIRAIADLHANGIGPGSFIRLHAGHYAAAIIIPLTGTAAAPVTIEGADDGPIDIDGSIVLDGAAFVVVRDLHIAHAEDAGIILRHGSHDDIVSDNVIDDTNLGVWLGAGAGSGNRIEGNRINKSATHGIAIDGVRATPGRETVLAHNHIEDSGIHGIEISGNYTLVEGNDVSGSGRLSTGASGIHVFAKHAGEDIGLHNLIRGNTSSGNHDASAQDGNGIQIDQWCDDNIVSGNTAEGNDGAGISIFDAARARVSGNTLAGNMHDPGQSHRHRGELVFATDDEHDADNTRDAIAEGNIITASGSNVADILVDVPTSRHPPVFSGNTLSRKGPGSIARWDGHDVAAVADWNALAPHPQPDVNGAGLQNP